MPERTTPFSLEQIGGRPVRFPSGAPIPTIMDNAVNPYVNSSIPKGIHVEGMQFWPQVEKGTFPAVVLLHDKWGLTSHMQDLGRRLSCEGYVVLLPNLYGRQGGMITANDEVADTLVARTNWSDLLQDVNSCCEFLNTLDYAKRFAHGVVGFGLGGSLAGLFACRRKRLRAAVSIEGSLPLDHLSNLTCPFLYHWAAADPSVGPDLIAQAQHAAETHGKRLQVLTHKEVASGFCNAMRSDLFHAEAASAAWDATVTFLHDHLLAEATPA